MLSHRHLYLLVGFMLVALMVRGLMTGTMTLRGGGVVARSQNPLGYWFILLMHGVLAVTAFGFFLHAP